MSSPKRLPPDSEQGGDRQSAGGRPDSRYRLLIESMPLGVVHFAPDGRILDVNAAAQDILGRSKAELLGSRVTVDDPHILREDGSALPLDQYPVTRVLRSRQTVRGVVMGVFHPDGNDPRWIRVDAMPLEANTSEEAPEVVALLDDITERKELHDALRRSEARFRSLADNSPDVHTRVDLRDNRLIYVSPSCEAVLGFTADELMRTAAGERNLIVDPSDALTVKSELEKVAAEGHGQFEFRARSLSDAPRWFWAMVTIVHDGEGRPRYRDSILRDVTARRNAEGALQSADKQRNYFVATLAHELRNPLAPISSVITILGQSELPDAQRRSCVAILERQVAHMRRLLDDLFDVSRATLGRLELHRVTIDLRDVIARAIEESRLLVDDRHHQLMVTMPPEPVYVNGDADRLVQVVGNLLANAVKYTDHDGAISVKLVRHPSTVSIRVRDNGIGLAEEDIAQLFVAFGQIDAARYRSEGGLGIGLSLVKSVVELHGGRVAVSSDGAGKGTEFEVHLPAADAATFAPPASQTMEPFIGTRLTSVLVVDDHHDGAESMALLLRAAGFQATTCHDGATAIELGEAMRPDVMLLDLELPKVSGFDVCRAVRRSAWGANIMIVAMTGWGREDDKARTRAAGFDAHLTKPVAIAELLSVLR